MDSKALVAAVAKIPDDHRIQVLGRTRGRPEHIPSPTGDAYWTRELLLERGLPEGGNYFLKPVAPDGVVSSKKFSLDLSIDQSSFEIGSSKPPEGTELIAGTPTDAMVHAWVSIHARESDEISRLREKLDEKSEEIASLRLEIAELKAKHEYEREEGTLDKMLIHASKGPTGAMVMEKVMRALFASSTPAP